MFGKKINSLFFAFNIGFTAFCNPTLDVPEKLDPNSTVISWDYHDVLAEAEFNKIYSHVTLIVKKDPKLLCLLVWPPFLYKLYKSKKEASNTEELLSKLSENYTWLKPHWNELIKIANLHKPIHETVNVLKKLKKQGYRNYLASNIGEQSLKIAQQSHKDIFNQFDGIYMPPKNENSSLVAKPSGEYFNGLRNYLQSKGHENKTALFIDDKQKNVMGAINSNRPGLIQIIGIKYTSCKQLTDDLYQKITLKENLL